MCTFFVGRAQSTVGVHNLFPLLFSHHAVSNWTFAYNTITDVNFGPGKEEGDMFIDNSVPVFSNGKPTTQCQRAPAPINFGLNISFNTLKQGGYGPSALIVYSTNGITAANNVITRNGAAPKSDLECITCVAGTALGNTCDGGPCSSTGFGA